jgi:GNAT superfamily N-acetyltransferase
MHASIHPVSPPSGYPVELEQEVSLADGTRVHLRPVVPEDADVLANEILTADPETLYLRFFTTSVRPDEDTLERLTVMDYRTSLAVGCITPGGEPIGIARYVALDDKIVEVAVAVKPGWRRTGVADRLLDAVERAAADRGYLTVSAVYLAENAPAAGLFAGRGYAVGETDRGTVEIALDLKAPEPAV